MDTEATSSGTSDSSLPQSYARPESEPPPPSQVSACEIVPVIGLRSDNRASTVPQMGYAWENHGHFLVNNHGVPRNAVVPFEEEWAIDLGSDNRASTVPQMDYSGGPFNAMRLSPSFNVDKENVRNWRDCLGLHGYPLSRHESFYAGTVATLGLLATAFTPLLQHPVLTPPWRSFMLSNYCGMVMLSTTALVADLRLRRAGPDSRPGRCSEILRTMIILTSSLGIISLLSITNPYVALVSLLVWFFLAIYLSLNLYGNLNQPMLPLTVNTTSNSMSA